ncbi:putative olfactory receptor GPCRLTM7 [Scleropages formosus]|uniref:Putative olfactory receptor GPCRLTM7 n=1 Tax=Scleropages formosus TaxID=113540 RepID=A0A0P7TIW6_SCLFO|nr:putative olfactory receptor GPCRLTM7 [Scleropages formosus]
MSFVWIALIYTYFRVLFTTKTATTDPVSTKKAQNTILLHGIQLLFCMMSYITPLLELILFPLFPNDKFKIMYILYIHLVINDMIILCITVTLHAINYAMSLVNVSTCCVLLLEGSVTNKNTPLSLTRTTVERYITICKPLRYSQICTMRRTYMLIILI